jgi:hypothetical protein
MLVMLDCYWYLTPFISTIASLASRGHGAYCLEFLVRTKRNNLFFFNFSLYSEEQLETSVDVQLILPIL